MPAEDVAKAGELPKRPDGAVRSDFFGSWTTPVIVRANNRDEMVCNLARRVAAFDPKTADRTFAIAATDNATVILGVGFIESIRKVTGSGVRVSFRTPRPELIADQLAIGEATVKSHVSNILSKLGANDRAHAVTIGLKRGIINL